MGTIRVAHNKDNPYSIINKTGLNDEKLSFKAKGILAYLLSKPDDWTCQVLELQKHATDGRDSIYSGLKELKKQGYLIKRPIKNELNMITEWEEVLYEIPQQEAVEIFSQQEIQQQRRKETFQKKKKLKSEKEKKEPHTENQDKAFPYTEKPYTENTDNIISNNIVSTDKLNNESINNNTSKESINLEDSNRQHEKIDDNVVFVKILSYYKTKSNIVIEKPADTEFAIQLQEEKIPLEIIESGIDTAFESFKPKYEGEKIRSLRYCESFIRTLWLNQQVKSSASPEEINAVKCMIKRKIECSESAINQVISSLYVNSKAEDKIQYLQEKLRAVDNYAKGKEVNVNYIGCLITAIKGDWKSCSNSKVSGHFDDFPQRSYDFNSLERKLLGYDCE